MDRNIIPIPKNQIHNCKMKLSALSIAAVFVLFAQTMAEPLPLVVKPPICPLAKDPNTFHCRSSMNISIHALISH